MAVLIYGGDSKNIISIKSSDCALLYPIRSLGGNMLFDVFIFDILSYFFRYCYKVLENQKMIYGIVDKPISTKI